MNANKAEEEDNSSDWGVKKMTDEELRKKINDTAEKVIGCAYTVSNTLGVGFLETTLKATGKKMCLLLNFGQARMDFKRVVLDL